MPSLPALVPGPVVRSAPIRPPTTDEKKKKQERENFNNLIAFDICILLQNLSSDLSRHLLSFIFSHILVCVNVGQAKKAKVSRKSVCKCE